MLAVSALRSVSVEQYVASLPADEQEVARHVLLGGFQQVWPTGRLPPCAQRRRASRQADRRGAGSFRRRYLPGRVSIWDLRRGWVPKKGEHMMFPDHWSREEVLGRARTPIAARLDKVALRWRSLMGGASRSRATAAATGAEPRRSSRIPTFERSLDLYCRASMRPRANHLCQIQSTGSAAGAARRDAATTVSTLTSFIAGWPDLLARPNDPEAEYFGNGICLPRLR